jgi:hypothetical protein
MIVHSKSKQLPHATRSIVCVRMNPFILTSTRIQSVIPLSILEYIETSYDILLLELYYSYGTDAVSVITAHKNVIITI